MKKGTLGFVAIVIAGAIVAGGVRIEANEGYSVARKHYVEDSQATTKEVARHVQTALRSIYESSRTITFLPSVRQIDRHGRTLDSDGRETIQQIYNNLASTVSVSEVYIVPLDLTPDMLDHAT